MERRFRQPRVWSNAELSKFAPYFTGNIVNVSGWTDEDKEGRLYKDYFKNATSYSITNFEADKKGFQGLSNEIFLDLEANLSDGLINKYDVVFNHTTLEHVFNVFKAFENLTLLSREAVIVVVPYIQQIHGLGYLDFWRFTPHSMKKLFEMNGMNLRYCSCNGADRASQYLFCIGLKTAKYEKLIPSRFDLKLDESKPLYGDDYRNVIGSPVFE